MYAYPQDRTKEHNAREHSFCQPISAISINIYVTPNPQPNLRRYTSNAFVLLLFLFFARSTLCMTYVCILFICGAVELWSSCGRVLENILYSTLCLTNLWFCICYPTELILCMMATAASIAWIDFTYYTRASGTRPTRDKCY